MVKTDCQRRSRGLHQKLFWILLGASGTALPAQEPTPGLTPIQLMQVRQVVSVLPGDDQDLAFTRTQPRLAGVPPGPPLMHLFQLVEGREVPIWTGAVSVNGVAWQPGARRLTTIFRPKDSPHPEVCTFDQPGVEPVPLTKTPNGVKSYRWRPDGKALAFVAADPAPEARLAARAAGFRQVIHDEDWTHDSLWLWERETGAIRRLTEGKTVFGYQWAPDGKRLAAALAPRHLVDDSYMFARLHLVHQDGVVESLVENPGKLAASAAWSPDGSMLAYIAGADRNDPHAGMLYVVDVATKKVTALTEGLRGTVNHVAFGSDGAIRAAVSLGVRSTLMRIDPKSLERTVELSADGQEFREFALSKNGTIDLFRLSTPSHPFEVYAREGDQFKRATDSNPWLSEVALASQEIVSFRSRDGLEIEGILMHPLRRDPNTRSPLVIVVHGGPEAHFSNGWLSSYSNWGQVLAAKGYAVWYPNYRASTGYGVEFAKANFGDVMGGEFNDHLDAIDHFDKKGLIDPARVGIGGGSYGGYAAAFAATRHTDRFAAAVSFVPFVDIRTKWFTSDIPFEFYLVHYEEKWPHEQVGYLSDRSPLTHAAQCRTPLLLLGGTADTRVHPSQPMMLHRAVLFQTKTPTRYVQYPGEGHGNRTNVAQYDYLIRTIRWFDHYLQSNSRRNEPLPPLDLDYSEWYATNPGTPR